MSISSGAPGWAQAGFATLGRPFFIDNGEAADLGQVAVGNIFQPWGVGSLSMDEISVLSTIYLYVAVTCTLPDGSNVNPSSAGVAFAFLPSGTEPTGETTWATGQWMTTGAGYSATVLAGPGGSGTMDAGVYDTFVKITNAPETIVLPCGPLTLY